MAYQCTHNHGPWEYLQLRVQITALKRIYTHATLASLLLEVSSIANPLSVMSPHSGPAGGSNLSSYCKLPLLA